MRFSLIVLTFLFLLGFGSYSMAEGGVTYFWSASEKRKNGDAFEGEIFYEITQGEETKRTDKTRVDFSTVPEVGTRVCLVAIEVIDEWSFYSGAVCKDIISPPKEAEFRAVQIVF